jgi:hypothetical protein
MGLLMRQKIFPFIHNKHHKKKDISNTYILDKLNLLEYLILKNFTIGTKAHLYSQEECDEYYESAYKMIARVEKAWDLWKKQKI